MSPIEQHPLDDRGSFSWLLGPSDPASRASTALVLDAGTLLIDPLEADGLDELLAPLPPLIGVTSLLDRHGRDAAAIADRRGVPRLVPAALGGPGLGLAGAEERPVIVRPRWKEALLWVPDRKLLICPETLGTAPFDLASPNARLGMHPLARVYRPAAAFAGLDPAVIAVGHGPPLRDAEGLLAPTLASGVRGIPRSWLRLPLEAFRASRAARRARR